MPRPLIDYLLLPGEIKQERENLTAQTEYLNAQAKQMKIQTQLAEMNQKQLEQINQYIATLPIQQQIALKANPEFGAFLVGISNRGFTEPQAQMPQAGRPRPQMVGPQGDIAPPPPQPSRLTSEIAEQQLGLGEMKDIIKDYAYKKWGLGRQADPVRTQPMMNPETNQWEMAQILRNGEIRFLGMEVPEDITWQETVDPETGQPIKVPMPTKMPSGAVPRLGLRQPVKPERRTIKGPLGEEAEERFDPFTGKPASRIPTVAPKGKPAETAGRIALVSGGIKELELLKNLVFNKDGTINRTNLGHAMLGTPRTKGRTIKNMLFRIIDPIMRAATGAAVPEQELRRYVDSYSPTYLASDEEIMRTWEALGDFLRDYLTISDPTGELAKSLGSFDKAMQLPRRGLEKRPQRTIRFRSGEKEYDIPMDKINEFMKAFPKAQRVSP